MITPEQQQQIQASLKANGAPGVTPGGGSSWYASLKQDAQPTAPVTPTPASNPIMDAAKGAVHATHTALDDIGTTMQKNATENPNPGLGEEVANGADLAGKISGLPFDAVGGAAGTLIPHQIKNAVGTAVQQSAEAVTNNPQALHALNAINGLVDAHPELAKLLGGLGATAFNIAGTDTGGTAVSEGAAVVKDAAGNAVDAAGEMAGKVKDALIPAPMTDADVATAKDAQQTAAIDTVKKELQKTADKYPSTVGSKLSDMTRLNGTDPLGVISSYGKDALPSLNERGHIDANEPMAFLNNRIGELSGIKNDALFTNDNTVHVDDFRKYANDLIDSQGWSEQKKADAHTQLEKQFDSLKSTYGDKPLSLTELDKLKTEHTGLSKAYNNSGAKPFELDTHGMIGKAARNLVEMHTEDAPTKELNKFIQSHYDAIDVLDAMQGKAPHGGVLSRSLGRMTGEITGAVAGGAVGHPFIGAMAGRAGSDMVTGILNSHFISNPLKRQLVNSMESVDPAVKKEMLKYIDEHSPDIGDLGDTDSQRRNLSSNGPTASAKSTAKITTKNGMKGSIRPSN